MRNISRRRYLQKGIVLGSSLLFPTMTRSQESKDVVWDVVVIGSGMAGLCAACSAKLEGAEKVLVLEKGPLVGGHTLYSSGSIAAVSPKRQLPQNIQDSVEKFIADAQLVSGNTSNETLLKIIAENSEAGLDWLESLGIAFCPVFLAQGGVSPRSVARPGNLAGRSYIMALMKEIRRLNIAIQLNSPVHGLWREFDLWRLQLGINDNSILRSYCVIIATGGFTANIPWRMRINNDLDDSVHTSANPDGTVWDGATGDGILLAKNVGASITDKFGCQLICYWGGRLLDYAGGDIYINQQGKRFINENAPLQLLASEILKFPDKYFWVLTDSKSLKDASLGLKLINGIVHKSSTLTEAAEGMRLDPIILQKTLDRYNAFAQAGLDTDFGKDVFAQTIDTPPFYWGAETAYVHTSLDGIVIDSYTNILDTKGNAITNLFAAGETVGNIFGKDRLGGAALTSSLVLGKKAGKQAAIQAKSKLLF